MTEIIALKYLEPDYQQTLDCLSKVKYPIHFADRDGVGNMSRAFNQVIEKVSSEYVWLVTNIVFEPSVPEILTRALEEHPDLGAIHPYMNSSDHLHIHKQGEGVRNVPFVELTAPMFRTADLKKFMLCEQTPYYYMDLIISHQIKGLGKGVAVHDGAGVDHTYLRNNKTDHPISRIRRKLRQYHTPLSKIYMAEAYGNDWEQKLWPK